VPTPVFSLTAGATTDEGNNWINISWGPLSLITPTTEKDPSTETALSDYSLAASSPAIGYITPANSSTTYAAAPTDDFFGTLRKTNGMVDAGAVEFTGAAAPAPTLTAVTPNSGRRSSAVPVTLTGTNLTGATAVTVGGAGVTASGITVVDSNTVTATFTITATAALTTRTVSITTPGGSVTLNNAFTVAAPTLTAVSPSSGLRGTTVPVTLTGTGLTGATGVTVSGAGVTASAVTVVDSTTVHATFTITAGAGLTARNVTVVTPGGNTNALAGAFTVVAPTLTSVSPNTGVRGTAVPVTLTGTGLTGATGVTISGAGVTASAVTVVDSTTVHATFTITAGAALTARNVTVNTSGGNTNALAGAFTVQGATLASIAPTTGLHNTTVPVTLTGTNLAGATAVTFSGGGITCTGISSTATTISANCAITNGAAHTARNVTATTPQGTTNTLTGAFTVN
jgi:hypothetical protein